MVFIQDPNTQALPRLYSLTLDDDGSPTKDKSVNKPGTLAAGEHPILYTNYPIKGEFKRDSFHPVKFIKDPHLLHAYCDINLDVPGAYQYRVAYRHEGKDVTSQTGYVIAEPRIKLPSKDKSDSLLPLDGLVILSMVPKWMGPITEWQSLLDTVEYSGYNMIHFVPLQKRGVSNSPYSISDQLAFDDDVFDPKDRKKSNKERLAIVQKAIGNIHEKHGILSLSDVVWNHTSNSTDFLLHHPEAGYNLHNSPHLVPAYELDTALIELSDKFDQVGLPKEIRSDRDADVIVEYIKTNIFKDLKLYEYKVIDLEKHVDVIRNALKGRSDKLSCNPDVYHNVYELDVKKRIALFGKDVIRNGHLGTRFHKTIHLPAALSFLLAFNKIKHLEDVSDDQVENLVGSFKNLLNDYNLPLYEEYDEECKVALDNIKGRLLFTRLAENGPKLGPISKNNPVIETYFTRLEDPKNVHPSGSMMLANNGWIWNADPLKDFAGPDSSAYLRREVIIWGDCVKLRYGKAPEDNPWLWKQMRDYTEQVASMFHGIRIDNCHSTPIHVAEYFLDAARKIRPDLYVLAELFTGSAERDNDFVSRLGIHALIREAMQAWDTHELSRLAHRHGGKPVGSMDEDMIWKVVSYEDKKYEKVLSIPVTCGSMPRALFMDCTHDNETPFQKRTPEVDALPNAAIVAFSDCATGSVKGYDEIYPRLLDIVNEKGRYDPHPNHKTGIIEAKRKLNLLHRKMCLDGYREVYVHQENDFLLVHRQHPGSQNGYLLISRTAFPGQGTGHSPIRLRGSTIEFEFAYSLKIDNRHPPEKTQYLQGLPSHLENLNPPEVIEGHDEKGRYSEIILSNSFTPGSICVVKTSIGDKYAEIHEQVTRIDDDVVSTLNLLDCNVVLYRCASEEISATSGDGVYNVPNFGELVYAGLQGFMSVLNPIIASNDLGHPFCDNLRAGLWAVDYTVHHLKAYLKDHPNLASLINWFESRSGLLHSLPDFLVPKYFALTIKTAYDKVYAHALTLMSPLVQRGDRFIKQLAITSVQLCGKVPNAGLNPLESTASLAAGLPHFTVQHMRVWGRDVFISLRGLLMVTGQYEAAKHHIISFAGSLRHGLIPNLLDSVRYPRYNSRDSVWFFLQAIQDYYHLAPDGPSILKADVPRRFPKDDRFVEVEEGYKYSVTMAELIQEIMERHARGIHFREHNAGPAIDSQMTDEGFNIDIEVDWGSGVLVGGNIWNCGTWMDKMGESPKAKNKGYPGTPRDGAPVEITGLLKSTLRWINELVKRKEFQWSGVDHIGKEDKTITYHDWNELLQANFERVYYIPQDPAQDKDYDVISKIINRRGIYKDVYKATYAYTEYQLRPNFAVAMTVAPELFRKEHAQQTIKMCKDILLGPLGMKTLDPADQQYRPYYHNSDDSEDFQTAKGRNYHQGPEWLWPLGYFLRAALHFQAIPQQEIARILREHRKYIEENVWCGLPELTNKDGEFCPDSCTTQAWSAATLLDLIHDLIEGA
ncbi:glycogen debranching enzyme [Rhizopus delemar RA 99-880]|uniref:Glycogen debranching enzyme n=1 Tax=Rhizopus delemar (strain RA 99-880 / ATCC MYA-4621 / FGSC 9543 / NRRL 43880) TaxID=246409 RepID=I1C152_RHIO9|nr:glycogen debranching enzyme [Rhizopus delemar RA 99-880]|eukprot:EIE82182.1 glycogen debranching enzyme [Rhizopus delemar RA 99-880]